MKYLIYLTYNVFKTCKIKANGKFLTKWIIYALLSPANLMWLSPGLLVICQKLGKELNKLFDNIKLDYLRERGNWDWEIYYEDDNQSLS